MAYSLAMRRPPLFFLNLLNLISSKMKALDFFAFQRLICDVCLKAFGEPLFTLSYAEARALSWLIEDKTGQVISYKTLINYSRAAQGASVHINPNVSTLAILVRYLYEDKNTNDLVIWNAYRHAAVRPSQAVD